MPRTALITGASGGIGLELARLFARDGHHLVLVARGQDKLSKLAEEITQQFRVQVHVLAMDLAGGDRAAKEIFAFCEKRGIHIDYLVNNAGFGDFDLFVNSDWKKQLEMIQVNIVALTALTHLFLPGMVFRKFGKIMNLASTAAFQPGPTMSVYYATKAFVLSFSEAISNELEGSGVTVTALCPGATESGFQAAAALEESKMVKGKKLPSSAAVALFGYRAMMKGKVVAIHGFLNGILATSVRFTPRFLVRKIVRNMQEKAS